MHLFTSPKSFSFLEPSLPLSFTLISFFEFLPSICRAFLLNTEASLATFRQTCDIPDDVEVAYCHESEISLHRRANTAFFPLMAILEGGIRFPMDPLLLNTLRYYGLYPDQLPSFVLSIPASSSPSMVSGEKRPAENDLVTGPCPYSATDHSWGVYTPQHTSWVASYPREAFSSTTPVIQNPRAAPS